MIAQAIGSPVDFVRKRRSGDYGRLSKIRWRIKRRARAREIHELSGLKSLRRCIVRLEEKRVSTAEELSADPDSQDIISLNLTRAVQLCVDIASHVLASSEEPAPASMGEAFEGIAHLGLIDTALSQHMKAAVGFRNIAVHNYEKIDWGIVHAITWHRLDDFRTFARVIAACLDDQPARDQK